MFNVKQNLFLLLLIQIKQKNHLENRNKLRSQPIYQMRPFQDIQNKQRIQSQFLSGVPHENQYPHQEAYPKVLSNDRVLGSPKEVIKINNYTGAKIKIDIIVDQNEKQYPYITLKQSQTQNQRHNKSDRDRINISIEKQPSKNHREDILKVGKWKKSNHNHSKQNNKKINFVYHSPGQGPSQNAKNYVESKLQENAIIFHNFANQSCQENRVQEKKLYCFQNNLSKKYYNVPIHFVRQGTQREQFSVQVLSSIGRKQFEQKSFQRPSTLANQKVVKEQEYSSYSVMKMEGDNQNSYHNSSNFIEQQNKNEQFDHQTEQRKSYQLDKKVSQPELIEDFIVRSEESYEQEGGSQELIEKNNISSACIFEEQIVPPSYSKQESSQNQEEQKTQSLNHQTPITPDKQKNKFSLCQEQTTAQKSSQTQIKQSKFVTSQVKKQLYMGISAIEEIPRKTSSSNQSYLSKKSPKKYAQLQKNRRQYKKQHQNDRYSRHFSSNLKSLSHHHKNHCYTNRNQKTQNLLNSIISIKQTKNNNQSTSKQNTKSKTVRVNLNEIQKQLKADKLFQQHKQEILVRLKHRQSVSNQLARKLRPKKGLSPQCRQVTQRLYYKKSDRCPCSHDEYYNRHSQFELFRKVLQEEHYNLMQYFTEQQLRDFFIHLKQNEISYKDWPSEFLFHFQRKIHKIQLCLINNSIHKPQKTFNHSSKYKNNQKTFNHLKKRLFLDQTFNA